MFFKIGVAGMTEANLLANILSEENQYQYALSPLHVLAGGDDAATLAYQLQNSGLHVDHGKELNNSDQFFYFYFLSSKNHFNSLTFILP